MNVTIPTSIEPRLDSALLTCPRCTGGEEVDDVREVLQGLGQLPPLELSLYHDGVSVGARLC